jgi:hypothetical protein
MAKAKDLVDVCIIGSGAGGAPMALELGRAGYKVVILEKGAWYKKADFYHDEILNSRRNFFMPFPPTTSCNVSPQCFVGGRQPCAATSEPRVRGPQGSPYFEQPLKEHHSCHQLASSVSHLNKSKGLSETSSCPSKRNPETQNPFRLEVFTIPQMGIPPPQKGMCRPPTEGFTP